jgi:limonene-1,2-epoxide hydrolase
MGSKDENIKVVEAFLNCLKNKDLSQAPLSDDLYFTEPLMGEGRGAEALKAFVSGFFPALDDLRVLQHVSEGDYVATRWEVDGVFGTIPVFELFRVSGGKIAEFRAFYDPRPILG